MTTMAKLDGRDLEALAAKPGRHGDSGGLFLRVLPGAKAYWVYRYSISGRVRELSMGGYPAFDLDEARAKHAELRSIAIRGGDPLAKKRAVKINARLKTFGEVADEYFAARKDGWKNDKHREQWRTSVAEHCKPICETPVDLIDTASVLRCLKPIWERIPETASRVRGRIEAIIAFAQADGLIEETRPNPARWKNWLELKLPNPQKLGERGHHAAMPYRDIPAFMKHLEATPGVAAKALRFLILTAARSGEVFGMKFREVDFGTATWAASTGQTSLSTAALAIISDQLAKCGKKQELAFESPVGIGRTMHRDGAHQPLSAMSLIMTMRRLGAGQYTVHGMQNAFRSWAADAGVEEKAISERRRWVMQAWACHLTGAPAQLHQPNDLKLSQRVKERAALLALRTLGLID
jgi:integrase